LLFGFLDVLSENKIPLKTSRNHYFWIKNIIENFMLISSTFWVTNLPGGDMTQKKDTYHHENLREQLIDAALNIITKDGLESLTMRSLSQAVGASRTAAYRHFENKLDLLCRVAETGFLEIARGNKTITTESRPNARETLEQLGRAYVGFALENPALYRLMFGPKLTSEERPPFLHQAADQAFAPLLATVELCQKQGCLMELPAQAIASVLWSTMHGISSLLIDGQLQTMEESHGLPVFLTSAKGASLAKEGRVLDLAVATLLKGLVPDL
jgi:AcrR family transcriptional regulator